MTITNLFVSHARALVAQDSLLYDLNDGSLRRRRAGGPVHMQKIHCVSHAHFVFASSGHLNINLYLHKRAMFLPDVDAALELLPRLLSRDRLEIHGLVGSHRAQYPNDHVFIVGWSPTQKQIVAKGFFSDDSFENYAVHDLTCAEGAGRVHLMPLVELEGFDLFDDFTPAALFDLTKRQCAENQDGAITYGGRVICADVTCEGINLTVLGSLDELHAESKQ